MNRRLATAAASLLLLAATVATAAPASAAPVSGGEIAVAAQDFGAVSVRGTGDTVLTAAFNDFAGDPVRISVDARAATNTDPRGTRGHFHVRHVHHDGRLVADFEGDITCLGVGGRQAIATGVITKGEAPWFPGLEVVGQKVSLSVEDNGRHGDRLGWIWGALGQPVSDCQGTVPFIRTTGGDLTVRG
ncbi:hypothetical protein GCM10018790_36750 [Kitasatospora xanthocidica]|uniref:hypothetical protein n=1 Tax=Kitasatospora xanthocidica TaxID=83382 RepID=UPI001672EB8E|nr:hypothetical protein [Kitasatospora xanthocidica]GHF55532.1 hypothetical protein GCM10018790_36750 [Kitasatospora xanthocidica]